MLTVSMRLLIQYLKTNFKIISNEKDFIFTNRCLYLGIV